MGRGGQAEPMHVLACVIFLILRTRTKVDYVSPVFYFFSYGCGVCGHDFCMCVHMCAGEYAHVDEVGC